MERESDRRARELKTALRTTVRRHAALEQRPALENGTADLVVGLATEAGEPRALLKIRGHDSTLIVVRDATVGERRQETIDLKLDDGFCWDEMVCATAEELADILLQHVHRRLRRADGRGSGRGAG